MKFRDFVVTLSFFCIAFGTGVGCGDSAQPNGDGNGTTDDGPSGEAPGGLVEIADCSEASSPVAVEIADSSYNPKNQTISENAVVQWTNEDQSAHTVTSGDEENSGGVFDSGEIAPGESWCLRFTEIPGAPYDYYCTIHGSSQMSGTLNFATTSGS